MSNVKKKKNKIISFSVGSAFTLAAVLVVVTACTNSAKAKAKFIFKSAPKDGVVAKVGGELVTEEQLIGEARMEFFELKKREYEMKMNRLNKILVDELIGAEAKKANMELEDYISKKVVQGDIKISKKEYDDFVKKQRIPENQINDQIKEKIDQYLKTLKRQDKIEAYVAKLTQKTPVEVYFKKPRLDIDVEVAKHSPTFGKKDAAITIVEFSDFQCPFCSQAAETVSELKNRYGKKVKFAFRHFPLPSHPSARPAAEASMCVNEQSESKFWKFHDLVFQNQKELSASDLEGYAKRAGADVEKFKKCMSENTFKTIVQEDLDYGTKLGVRSTPTFFVNGQIISGALPVDAFAEIIDEELEMAN